MKKFILLFLFILPLTATSQTTKYGITIGVVPTTTVSESHHFTGTGAPEGFTSRAAYSAGFAAIFPLSRDFAIDAGIQYTGKSVSTRRQGLADGDVLATLDFMYVRFVSRVQYNPVGGFVLTAGPVFDLIRSNSLDAVGDWPRTQNPIPGTRSYRVGAMVSTGYMLEIGTRMVLLPELSYDKGLSKTSDYYGGRYSSTEFSLSILIH